jgi:hypothetical protein
MKEEFEVEERVTDTGMITIPTREGIINVFQQLFRIS